MIFYYAKLSELLKQYWYSIYMVNISYFVCLVSLDVMAIFLQKKEFSRCIDTENYQFFQEDQVFVMWNWQWLENSDSDSEQDDVNKDEPENVVVSNSEESGNEEEDEEDNDVPAITHSVVFKCIGCTKELRYQELLALANQKMKKGEAVPVKLQREPSNPYDSNAIAFMCKAQDEWERIGYVVSEALTDVKEAISNDKILKTCFNWIKYIVYYKQPGWYAGITVTRNGSWSTTVTQSCAKSY